MATATLFSEVDGNLTFDSNLSDAERFPFRVFVAWDESVTGLVHTDFSISATINQGSITARINRMGGSERLFVLECEIFSFPLNRSPRNGTITINLSANAVTEGNPAATLTFNYTYYYRTGVQPFAGTNRGDDFTLLASNVDRIVSLTYADGLLYACQRETNGSSDLIVLDPSDGSQDTAKTIMWEDFRNNGILLNKAIYCVYDKHIEKYLPVSSTDYSTLANDVEFEDNNTRHADDFIVAGEKGFYIFSELRTGSAAIADTPGVAGSAGSYTAGREGRAGSFTPPDSFTPGTPTTVGSYTAGTPTSPYVPGRPDTRDYRFIRQFVSYESFEALQKYPDSIKKITPEDYSVNTGDLPIVRYETAPYTYDDVFVIGYDGEHHYVRIGEYIYLADDDLRIDPNTAVKSVLGGKAYAFDDTYIYRASGNNLYRYEKAKLYKPQPRGRVYPILVSENSTIDLRKYVQHFTRIVFDENYDPQSFITLSGHTLSIGTVTAETAVSVKLRAVNNRGSTDAGEIVLDIVIQKPATTPTWVDFENITMAANTSLDVSNLVLDADSISSVTLPAGASFSGETLSIGTTGGTVTLRAVKGSNTADRTFTVDIETVSDLDALENREYLIEIAGIDVSEDLVSGSEPVISKSLDVVRANEYKVNTSTFGLRGRDGYYSSKTATNFWSANSLNPNGYREPVNIYLKYTKDGTEGQTLIFSGTILDIKYRRSGNLFEFSVIDFANKLRNISTRSPNAPLQSVGIEKYAQTTAPTEVNYEGVYPVETQMTPIIGGTVDAWTDGTALTLKDIRNPKTGVSVDNSAFVDNSAIRTQGGPVGAAPLMKYRIPHKRKRISFFTELLALAGGVLNPDFGVDLPTLESECLQSKGNVQYNVLPTRITHIFRDWVHDSTGDKIYMLLSQPDQNYQDILVEHDIDTDTQTILTRFDADLTCLKLAYAGSGTFYILTTESIVRDRSITPLPPDNLEVVEKYDRALGASSKIIRYVASTDTTTDFVASSAARPPQPGTHYAVGFTRGDTVFDWKGILPDSRGKFKVQGTNLYYRYATTTQYGIARATSGGTVTALWTINKDDYFGHLKFDFDVNSSGTVYFAHVEQSATGSTLYVKRRQGGTTTTILTDTKTFSQLTDTAPPIANTGGWYSGVHEVLIDGNDLYLCVEIGRTDEYYDTADNLQLTRSAQKGAGQAVYKVDVSAGTPSLTLITGYDFVQQGARSLVEHDSKVFFADAPAETYKFTPSNPDFSVDPIAITEGKLKSINSSGTVEDHGTIWWGDQHSKGITARALSIDDTLHLNAVYSNIDEVLMGGSVSSNPDNFQWIIYGTELEFILEEMASTDIFSALADMARKVRGVLKIDKNRIKITSRQVLTALLNGALTNSATTITYDNADNGLPSSGQGLIGQEIISWTGRTATQLTGVVRGVRASTASAHSDNATITVLDKLITQNNVLSQQSDIDTQRIYNIIQSPDFVEKDQDANSIAAFGELVFSLDLGLTQNDECWISYIFGQYLDEFKDVQNLVNIDLIQGWDIDLNEIINFTEGGIIQPVRVVSARYAKASTTLMGRTIS